MTKGKTMCCFVYFKYNKPSLYSHTGRHGGLMVNTPIPGSKNTPSPFVKTETGISSGLLGHLACMQT